MTNQNGNISIDDFVSREVIYCVSSLVSTLITAASESGKVGDIDQDELFDLCAKDDWEGTARDDGWEMLDGQICKNANSPTLYADDWREACEQDNLDPYRVEAYEHWIVSDWLAGKLEAKGEIVARDIAGLTIWGRCTTGQSISMDGVIKAIYNEMIGA